MTHDDMIAVIEAHRDGRPVEYRRINPNLHEQSGEWHLVERGIDFTFPFDFMRNEYRVNPEPREWWLVMDPDCPDKGTFRYGMKVNAETTAKEIGMKVIHVREVIECV